MGVRPIRLLPRRRQFSRSSTGVLRKRLAKDKVHVLLADLKSCSGSRNLEWGKRIHANVLESGNGSSAHVVTALVNMYAKCGSMGDAHRVFGSIRDPDVVSWNALLSGYADIGEGVTVLDLFSKMKSQGCAPDCRTYMAAFKACASLAAKHDGRRKAECLKQGKQLHSEIGCRLDIYVQNTLIGMYAKCGSIMDARQVFDSIKHPDVVSWTALILGYADCGEGLIALDLFSRMKAQGCVPNSMTQVAALKACACIALKQDGSGKAECLVRGRQVHLEIGWQSSIYVQNTLIDMYAKCGNMVDAHKVFSSIRRPDVVSWTALLSGYMETGEGLIALDLFSRMKSEGCTPDLRTYVSVLKACGSLALNQDCSARTGFLERGKQLHTEISCHMSLYLQNALIDMYAKCGSMVDAREVFDSMSHPDVVSWTALLLGYADNGEGLIALDLFSRMKSQGCAPNSITYVAALKACGLLGALEFGRKVHAEISEFDTILVTSLVDFYAKCGSLAEAQKVFDLHSERRDFKTCTALLAGYSSFGETKRVFGIFEGMQDAGFRPNGVTFQCILMSCSHAGLIEKARSCFEIMSSKYGVIPMVEHYTCMIDVLGRANKLDETLVLLRRMPCSPDSVTWKTILGACCKWKNVDIGGLAFQSLISLDERNTAAYVLMAHVYASKGMWEEQATVLGMRKKHQAQKVLGETYWTDKSGEVHTVLAMDGEHPQIQEIGEKMQKMNQAMREHGYVSHSVTEEELLCSHSEKLALVCALVKTEPAETIRMVKNARACDICHNMMAVTSKLEKRTILLKNPSTFHVFKDGKCSCDDYW